VLDAPEGEAALRICEDETQHVDIMLTDMVMPHMSGSDLYEKARRLRPDLRVLYMSGYTEGAIVHQGNLKPGTAFLQKPFSGTALARKVREVLEDRGTASDRPAAGG
jgi:YesN/AraC family two-component response regulator